MMKQVLKSMVLIGLAVMLSVVAQAKTTVSALKVTAWQPNHIAVFGDGLVYNGNNAALRASHVPLSPPYWYGRFSNGPVWVEDLGVLTGVLPQLQPGQAHLPVPHFADFALPNSVILWRDRPKFGHTLTLDQQIDLYALKPFDKKAHTLAIIADGSNDFAHSVCLNQPFRCVNNMVQDMQTDMMRLYLLGVHHFLIVSPRNIALTPRLKEKDTPKTLAQVSDLVAFYNRNLNRFTYVFATTHQHARALFFNSPSFLKEVVQHMGLQLKHACYNQKTRHLCADVASGNYYFWDNYYPTKQVMQTWASVAVDMMRQRTWFGAPTLAPTQEAPLPPSDSGDHYGIPSIVAHHGRAA